MISKKSPKLGVSLLQKVFSGRTVISSGALEEMELTELMLISCRYAEKISKAHARINNLRRSGR
jgi:hypothetical protein